MESYAYGQSRSEMQYQGTSSVCRDGYIHIHIQMAHRHTECLKKVKRLFFPFLLERIQKHCLETNNGPVSNCKTRTTSEAPIKLADASALISILVFTVHPIHVKVAAFFTWEMFLGRHSLFPEPMETTVHVEGGQEEGLYTKSAISFLDILENTAFRGSFRDEPCVPTHGWTDTQHRAEEPAEEWPKAQCYSSLDQECQLLHWEILISQLSCGLLPSLYTCTVISLFCLVLGTILFFSATFSLCPESRRLRNQTCFPLHENQFNYCSCVTSVPHNFCHSFLRRVSRWLRATQIPFVDLLHPPPFTALDKWSLIPQEVNNNTDR